MTSARLAAVLRVLSLAALVALLWLSLRTAHAQPAERVEALARVTVAEEGWTITNGHAAITHLLVRRADRLGLTPRQMARAYSGRHFDRTRTDGRRWIAGLRIGTARPRGWPRGARWSRYAPRWVAVVEHVSATLRGEVPDPCGDARPDHWGQPFGEDLARAAGGVGARRLRQHGERVLARQAGGQMTNTNGGKAMNLKAGDAVIGPVTGERYEVIKRLNRDGTEVSIQPEGDYAAESWTVAGLERLGYRKA